MIFLLFFNLLGTISVCKSITHKSETGKWLTYFFFRGIISLFCVGNPTLWPHPFHPSREKMASLSQTAAPRRCFGWERSCDWLFSRLSLRIPPFTTEIMRVTFSRILSLLRGVSDWRDFRPPTESAISSLFSIPSRRQFNASQSEKRERGRWGEVPRIHFHWIDRVSDQKSPKGRLES